MTVCELCGKEKVGKKRFNEHHISYKDNKTITLCYVCHCLVHGRLKFKNPFEAKYGKDRGFYELAKKFISVYEHNVPDGVITIKNGKAELHLF